MSTATYIPDETSNDSPPVTQFTSPLSQRLSRFVIGTLLLATIIISLQSIFPMIEYFQSQADAQISSDVWSMLYVWGILSVRTTIKLIFIAVGVAIYLRNPNEKISVITGIFLLSFAGGGIHYTQYVPDTYNYIADNNLYLAPILGFVSWTSLFLYFVYFPNGRAVPKMARLLIIPVIINNLAWASPTSSDIYPLNWPLPLLIVAAIALFGIPLSAQVYRYRHVSTQAQRQQTKIVLLGFIIGIISIITAVTIFGNNESSSYKIILMSTIGDGGFVAIPVTIGIAIAHYRLWNVDFIINRSLVYGFAIALVSIIIVAELLFWQLAIGETDPLVAVPISLIIAGLLTFQSRRTITRFVDRRIYGLRFEIEEVRAMQQEREITNPGALSGKTLGEYEILDRIGKGGMGEVYKASYQGNIVAIKTLLDTQHADAEILERFQREGEVGKLIKHPNIANVHGIYRDDKSGIYYLVMDYLDGEDLSEIIRRRGKLDPLTTTQVIEDLARALDIAHNAGLVHRDIKPSNVMVVSENSPREQTAILMDFGITKLKDANTITRTGAIGTIGYMAPEQIVEAKTVDYRADIYALGVMVFEMLTNRRPYVGGVGQVIFGHIQQPVPDPRDYAADIPKPVAKAIMVALAKAPEDRFQSAGQFAEALAKSNL